MISHSALVLLLSHPPVAVNAKLVIMSLVSWLSLDPVSANAHSQCTAFLDLIFKEFEIKKKKNLNTF